MYFETKVQGKPMSSGKNNSLHANWAICLLVMQEVKQCWGHKSELAPKGSRISSKQCFNNRLTTCVTHGSACWARPWTWTYSYWQCSHTLRRTWGATWTGLGKTTSTTATSTGPVDPWCLASHHEKLPTDSSSFRCLHLIIFVIEY